MDHLWAADFDSPVHFPAIIAITKLYYSWFGLARLLVKKKKEMQRKRGKKEKERERKRKKEKP